MFTKMIGIAFLLVLSSFQYAFAETERNSQFIDQSAWYNEKPIVFGTLKWATSIPGGTAGCGDPNDTNDKVMMYDASVFRRIAGSAYNPNKIYIYGVTALGNVALAAWRQTMPKESSSQERKIRASDTLSDWKTTVAICFGLRAQAYTMNGQGMSDVVLWYDGPIETRTSSPLDDGTGTGDVMTPVSGLSYGPGTSLPATDPIIANKPDFIIDRNRLFKDGTEQYVFGKSDTMCMEAKLKNIGQGKIDNDDRVRTRFLLSKGYKEDPHGDWIGIASFDTRGDHVEQGESHTETVCVSLVDKPYIVPGRVYNIVTCADRTEINNNDGGAYQEEHESNNCTTEMVFEVRGSYNFAITGIALSHNQPNAGDVIQATIGVSSTVDAPNADVPVSVFLSLNGDWNNRWIVDSFSISQQELQGGYASRVRNIAVPGSIGEFTLWVCANPNGEIPETYGNDNCQSVWLETLGTSPPQPQPLPGESGGAIISIIQFVL